MRKKKIYRIEVVADYLRLYLKELREWRVAEDRYQVEGNVITTADSNVVDVATETFARARHLITVTETEAPAEYLVLRRRSRLAGVMVELYDAEHADSVFDAAGGRWVTVCTEHNTLCNHQTKAIALNHMPALDWCEACVAKMSAAA